MSRRRQVTRTEAFDEKKGDKKVSGSDTTWGGELEANRIRRFS